MHDPEIRVLVLCGASGVGKTSTAWEIGHRLQGVEIAHAILDTDDLDRVWPHPEGIEARISISRRNLQSCWATFSAVGARHLVLCGVMASTAESTEWIADAIPGASIRFVRLVANHSTREGRLRRREIGSGFSHDMAASDRAATFIEAHDREDMLTVATDEKSVAAVVEEVLDAIAWIR